MEKKRWKKKGERESQQEQQNRDSKWQLPSRVHISPLLIIQLIPGGVPDFWLYRNMHTNES